MTVLIVARHGNTFEPGEKPRRIGVRTDLPLTATGLKQGANLGAYLRKINLLPDAVFTAQLQRTRQTAAEIIRAAGITVTPRVNAVFNEMDYGPDEDMEEEVVLRRLGRPAMAAWEEHGTVPSGWSPDSATITGHWRDFAGAVTRAHPGGIVLAVTSNGIARFALGLTGDFDGAARQFGLKLATGAIGILEYDGTGWTVQNWNIRP